MNEANVLVADNLHLVNKTEATKVIAEHFLSYNLVKTTEVNIAAGIALLDSEGYRARDGRGLAPTNLKLLTMKSEFLHERVGVESGGSCAIKEGQEDAGLLRENPNGLERAEVYQVQQLVDGGSSRKVTDVNSTPGNIALRSHSGRKRSRRVGRSDRRWDGQRRKTLLILLRQSVS